MTSCILRAVLEPALGHGNPAAAAPGPAAPAVDVPAGLCEALQHAPHADLNISLFQYFGMLSKSSQRRLIGSSREKTFYMKCPETLQPALPMGDLKKSNGLTCVAVILHVAYRYGNISRPCSRLSGTAAALALHASPASAEVSGRTRSPGPHGVPSWRDLPAGGSPCPPRPAESPSPGGLRSCLPPTSPPAPPRALSLSNISPHKAKPM